MSAHTRVASERLIGKIQSSWVRESFRVSPDSKRIAYIARVGKWLRKKYLVVVDGREGKPYGAIVSEGRIIFDSTDSFHYLAAKGADIYLVEERIE